MRQQSSGGSGWSHLLHNTLERTLTLHRSDLSVQERKQYTDAVLCLMSKPALTSSQAPGAKSRFDDYGMTLRPTKNELGLL
jgi:hypothetical protein